MNTSVCDMSSLMWKFSSSVLCLEMKQLYKEMLPQQLYLLLSVDKWQSDVVVWSTAVEMYLRFLSIFHTHT